MSIQSDIDIDFGDRTKLLKLIKHVPAAMREVDPMKKHPTGVYITDVPYNPFSGLSTIDHKEAEGMGYFKIDVINVGIYKYIETKKHLDDLLAMDPMWELLEHKEVVEQCFHIHKHFDIVNTMKPTSIEQLAAVLAVIRPAKRHLLNKGWDIINNLGLITTQDTHLKSHMLWLMHN